MTYTTPRVYIACLSAYNNGYLHGAWLPVDDLETLQEGIDDVLAGSPMPDAEEWAIHDHDGFEGLPISESHDLSELVQMAEALEGEYCDGFLYLVNDCGYAPAQALEKAEEVCFASSTLRDYAEELVYDIYGDVIGDMPPIIANAIDTDRIARDLLVSGDVAETVIDGRVLVVTNAYDF